MDWPFDNDYNYNYQTETFNLVYDTAEFNYKNLKGVNNRWLKLVDAAYVIGTGESFEKFKKQAEFQGIEEITHYVKIKKLKDLDQKFRIKRDYCLNNSGCHISQVSCCYNAMTKGYKNIIVFEDDCYFTKYITDDEIEALVNIKNKEDPSRINFAPSSLHYKYTCNRPEIELIQMPTFMAHFTYLNTVGMNQFIKTKYERPWKPFRLSGTAQGYIDRDWFGADDFWYSFTNSYVLGVCESKPWAIQYVPDDTEERNCDFGKEAKNVKSRILSMFYNNDTSERINNELVTGYGNVINNRVMYSCREKTRETQYNKEVQCVENIQDKLLTSPHIVFNYNTVSHNFSIFEDKECFIGVGGSATPSYIYSPARLLTNMGKYDEGLYLLKSTDTNLMNWTIPKLIIDRDWGFKNECCAFDSQPSMLYNDNDNNYYLYCRWNPLEGKRKLQVFITDNVDVWTNNYREVKLDIDIDIYTGHLFKHNNKIVGIIRYYHNENNIAVIDPNHMYNNAKIGLITSADGINFIFKKEIFQKYNFFQDGDITQGHKIINNNLIIYLLEARGNLHTHKIENFNQYLI